MRPARGVLPTLVLMQTRGRTTIAVVLASALALVLAYANKARCAGPPFTDAGRSMIFEAYKNTRVCYSDIQYLWLGRNINDHVFPYIHGGITGAGQLFGGTVEYPVLSGLLMWLGAIGARTDAAFLLHSALILAPFGLLTAWLLGRMRGWRALWWAASPALVLFAFHNWDLPAVATVVGAVFVMTRMRMTLRTRGALAAALLAIGACLKLYPGLFVLPIALAVLCDGGGGLRRPDARTAAEHHSVGVRPSLDVRGALAVVAAAVATAAAINLPFALLGFQGWWASFRFQGDRSADITTNSIWYWGLRPLIGDGNTYDAIVAVASPVLVVASFALALWLGWRIRARNTGAGAYPWLEVSAAMLCGFLLLHKVDSPQYALWLLPFFVLLRTPRPLVGGYLAANTVLGIGLFRYYAALGGGWDSAGAWKAAVLFGVWGQAVALVVAFVWFLRGALPREARSTAGPGGSTEKMKRNRAASRSPL